MLTPQERETIIRSLPVNSELTLIVDYYSWPCQFSKGQTVFKHSDNPIQILIQGIDGFCVSVFYSALTCNTIEVTNKLLNT